MERREREGRSEGGEVERRRERGERRETKGIKPNGEQS